MMHGPHLQKPSHTRVAVTLALGVTALLVSGSQSAAIAQTPTTQPFIREAKLTGRGADSNTFGSSVAVSGDVAVVGSPGVKDRAGSVQIFARHQSGPHAWREVATLTPTNSADFSFGRSVSISDDTLIVGAKGSAYIFARRADGANSWHQVARLVPADLDYVNESFGGSVSISGDETAVVGGQFAFGTVSISHPGGLGAAYVFQRRANLWSQVAKLVGRYDSPPDPSHIDVFGVSVSIDNNRIVVGASEPFPVGQFGFSTAYIFERPHNGPDVWRQVQKLHVPFQFADGTVQPQVSISGRTVVVAAGAQARGVYIL